MSELVSRLCLPLAALALVTLPAALPAACLSSGTAASVDEIVARVASDRLRYVFVGEQHAIGPVKRFVVDLANALVDAGYNAGLYVEGFRTNCPPREPSCWSLARAFNESAFLTLLDESRASVHPIDPPEHDRRAQRMATKIVRGRESVRVVLVGKTHVVHAGDGEAELWVYGGGVKYPDPGDLAEAFPRDEYVTVGLETADDVAVPYALRRDGCAADYVLATPPTRAYWSTADADEPTALAGSAR